MNTQICRLRTITAACAMALLSMSAVAADPATTREDAKAQNPAPTSRTMGKEARDAADQVTKATDVVRQMEQDSGMRKVLQQAQGIFIVPEYGRAALGIGAAGGEGVLLVKHGGKWSDPAFYNIGGVSIGAQAGAEGGAIAMILHNQKAVNSFMKNNNWSLDADAGLTLVNWSKKAQASTGKGDVTVWADTEGLLGDLAISVTDITFDEDDAAAYYGKQVAVRDIMDGKVRAPRQVASLKQALAGRGGATSTGDDAAGRGAAGTDTSTRPGDTSAPAHKDGSRGNR